MSSKNSGELFLCLSNIYYNERWNNNNWNMYTKVQLKVLENAKWGTLSSEDRDYHILKIEKWVYEDYEGRLVNVKEKVKYIKDVENSSLR